MSNPVEVTIVGFELFDYDVKFYYEGKHIVDRDGEEFGTPELELIGITPLMDNYLGVELEFKSLKDLQNYAGNGLYREIVRQEEKAFEAYCEDNQESPEEYFAGSYDEGER